VVKILNADMRLQRRAFDAAVDSVQIGFRRRLDR